MAMNETVKATTAPAVETAPVETAEAKAKRERRASKKFLIVDVATRDVFLADEFASANGLHYQPMLHRLNAAFALDNSKVIRVNSDHAALYPTARAGRRLMWIADGVVCSGFDVPENATYVIDTASKRYTLDGGATYLPIQWTEGIFFGTRTKKEEAAAL